jgi:hypothetical protein
MERQWKCTAHGCGKITDTPFRWVVGAQTTFKCDSCQGEVKEINMSEKATTEEILKKVSLLEQQVMALHQRMNDQCGKP